VAQARREWVRRRQSWQARNLVFIDETGAATNMTRRYGRARRGERCLAAAPHGHWHSNCFLAALRCDGVSAPLLLDGPVNGEAFRAYAREQLAPALSPGDIVIADNLSSHKVAGVREAIEAAGAAFIFLPPYSPDLNPIEMLFSKLKAHLRHAAQRTFEGLLKALKDALNAVSPQECENYFTAAGYVCS